MHLLHRTLAFAAGILLLEGTSSVLHAWVLRDIPPERLAQGVDLGWMLSRDLLLAGLGAAAYAFGALALSVPPRQPAQRLRPLLLGVVFASLLEGLNWIYPNALLAPVSLLPAVVAWSYFLGGAMLAVRLSAPRAATE